MKAVKTYSPKTKILSLILSFLIIFYLVPASVFAEELDNDTTVSDSSVSENEENNTYTPEIYEVTELREENVKHFRLADGSYVAAQYNYLVHYTDENGQLVDIDNRLTESGSELSTGNSRIKFVKKITGNGNIFTLHENNAKITMGLEGAEKKTKGVITSTHNSDDSIEDALGKMTNLENISSTIVYEDILDGVDIEYIVHSLNIKENIIVKERKENYSYNFTIELNNLIATLTDNGNIYINSLDGEVHYVIPAPTVFDAKDVYAPDNASAYTLISSGNGKYELNVTVDASWMNDEDRVFPITIDPPVLSSGGAVLDFNIDSDDPNSNTNGEENFYVSSTERAYLKFDENYFADIPIGASIMKAELNIIGYHGVSGESIVGAYAITSDWDNSLTRSKTLTVVPQGSFSSIAMDYVIINVSGTRYNWNITELYKSWLNGAPNYGIGLRLVDETSNESASFTAYEYCPPDDDVNFYEPAIMVTYIYNDGLEDYYPTSTHSAGIGGAGSINLSTGRLTLAIPTLTTTDSLFAFTPTLVYNSSLAGKSATSENVSSPFSTSYMPHGFKLNAQETIVLDYYYDENNTINSYYILYDADGSTHRFYRNSYSGPYYDEDGLQLTLTVETNVITIEDIDHNIKTYAKINSSSWHLTSIADKFGNQLIFEFNESYQPKKIYVKPNGLSSIEMLRFLYVGDKLCAVYNDTSKDAVVFRYSGNYLAVAEYYYGDSNTVEQDAWEKAQDEELGRYLYRISSATYTYNSSGHIIKITDNNTNQSLQYETTNCKITKLSEYAGTTLGQQVSFAYGKGYTDIRSTGKDETLNTSDDLITRHIFDGYGRSVSAYSYYAENAQIIGATMNSYESDGRAKNSIKESAVLYDGNATYLSNDDANYDRTLQGGIDKTAETGCFKKTVFEIDPETVSTTNANMQYVISGFGKSNSIIQNSNAKFSLSANVYYYQGEGVNDIVVTYHYDFLDVEDTWQFVSGKLDCKIGSTSPSIYDVVRKIEVVYNYYGQVNTGGAAPYAEFKDVAFTDCSDFSTYRYSYDVNTGNLVMKSNYSYREYYEYNDKNCIKRVANSKGEIYDYEYDTDGITLIREIYYKFNRQGSFPGNLLYDYPYGESNIEAKIYKTKINQTEYIHTDYGLLKSSTTYGYTDSTPGMISSSYTYVETAGSKIFGARLTETDSLGNVIRYFYDSEKGNLLAQIDVESGNGYVYGYSDAGELESVWPATGTATSYTKITTAEKVDYTYDPDTHRLTKITTDTTEYSFSYDSFGNSIGVTAGSNTLATYEYNENNGKIKKINYGNGFSEDYVYNTLEMLSEIWYTYNDGTKEKAYSYTYNADGTLDVFTNHLDETSIEYEYDVHGRLISSSEKDSSNTGYVNKFQIKSYDPDGRIYECLNTVDYVTSSGSSLINIGMIYNYNNDGTLKKERLNCPSVLYVITDYYYDCFDRVTKIDRQIDDFEYTTDYTYYLENSKTTGIVSEATNTVNGTSTTYNYTYDSKGNITKIVIGDKEIRYVYDDLGQLIREDNEQLSKTYTFTYDNAGNITIRETYPLIAEGVTPTDSTYTDYYGYGDTGWQDKLTSYKGVTITYDQIGNPLTYYNGSAYYTFTWTGRQLTTAVKGSNTMSFTYNDDGIRTSKTVNGETTTYYLNSSQIVAEETSTHIIVYIYDANGTPIGMQYRLHTAAENEWEVYWFEKNLQGDIVAVYNSDGNKCASYKYDAWGNCSTVNYGSYHTTAVTLNPFRYRGYYYDKDFGMYYLQSRYYDAKMCRFINADGYVSTGQGLIGNNMFAYCGNNPVNYVDYSGEFAIPFAIPAEYLIIGLLAVGMIALLADATGEQVLGNFVSDVVTQTTEAVDNFVDGIKSFSDSKADEKEEVNPNPSNPRYWKASIINGVVTPLEPLTYSQARDWVAAEQDLLCIDHGAAYAIVRFYPTAIWEPAHRTGYLNHYHLSSAHKNHIWYYGD